MSDEARPLIGDSYWFGISKKILDGSLERRDNAASEIQRFALWLWGAYTVAVPSAVVLLDRKQPSFLWVLSISSSISLIAVYWSCVWVRMPVPIQFDPRSPDEIQEAYAKELLSKRRRLNLSVALSIIAVALVSASFFGLASSKRATSPGLVAIIHSEKSDKILSVRASLGVSFGEEKVVLRIIPNSFVEHSTTLAYLSDESGDLAVSIPIDSRIQGAHIEIEWQGDDGLLRTLTRVVRSE